MKAEHRACLKSGQGEGLRRAEYGLNIESLHLQLLLGEEI